ncbi:putative polysaccharide biosynthesis protein [Planococcus kocurii]
MNNEGTMKTFMKGAVLLTIAGFIVKLLSAIYRVPFQNLVGDQGFYIYQQVYPFVAIFGIWTSYGFAIAISKLLADYNSQSHRAILRIAAIYVAGISVVIFVVMFSGAELLAGWMGDLQLNPLLKVGAFSVLLMAPLAVLKGYFQSANNMAPVAYAQVLEQGIRVTVILAGAWLVVSNGFSLYVAGQLAMLGAAIGGLGAVILLLVYFNRGLKTQNQMLPVRAWPIIKEMTAVSLSVSMSSLILVLFQLVDSFTVFRLLEESGMGRFVAMEQKGIYDRGQPLVQFGILIATSLTLAIVPLVARTSKKDSGRPAEMYARLAFRVSFLFAFAAAVGLTFVMPYVNETLFQTRERSGALIIFSWQIVWMSLLLIMTAMLHGLGKVRVPALLLVTGMVVKVIGNWLLLPVWGVTGAAVAGNIGLMVVVMGLLLYFKRVWPITFAPLSYYGWLFGAALAMSVVVFGWSILADNYLFDHLSSRFGAFLTTATAIPLGALIFMAIIGKSRIITEKEWYIIPFGRKLAKLQLAINSKKKGEKR